MYSQIVVIGISISTITIRAGSSPLLRLLSFKKPTPNCQLQNNRFRARKIKPTFFFQSNSPSGKKQINFFKQIAFGQQNKSPSGSKQSLHSLLPLTEFYTFHSFSQCLLHFGTGTPGSDPSLPSWIGLVLQTSSAPSPAPCPQMSSGILALTGARRTPGPPPALSTATSTSPKRSAGGSTGTGSVVAGRGARAPPPSSSTRIPRTDSSLATLPLKSAMPSCPLLPLSLCLTLPRIPLQHLHLHLPPLVLRLGLAGALVGAGGDRLTNQKLADELLAFAAAIAPGTGFLPSPPLNPPLIFTSSLRLLRGRGGGDAGGSARIPPLTCPSSLGRGFN